MRIRDAYPHAPWALILAAMLDVRKIIEFAGGLKCNIIIQLVCDDPLSYEDQACMTKIERVVATPVVACILVSINSANAGKSLATISRKTS